MQLVFEARDKQGSILVKGTAEEVENWLNHVLDRRGITINVWELVGEEICISDFLAMYT